MNELLSYSNSEQTEEVLNDISDKKLKPDKKKKIFSNANTIYFNGNIGLDDKFINYKKYHKNILNKNENIKKQPTIKIMSKEDNKHKILNRTFTKLKLHDDYNVHDYILSYEVKAKSTRTNFDNFSEKDEKLIFSKKGILIYDIQKNHFDNGKYNIIKFKIRENNGYKILNEKIKEVENDLTKKQFKINIEKEIENNKKRNLRGVVKNPFTKELLVIEKGE